MQLNIKDPETHALVTRLADATGHSRARVVKDSVRERLERFERAREEDIARRMAELDRITTEICARLPKDLPTQEEFDAWLYDENGLPH